MVQLSKTATKVARIVGALATQHWTIFLDGRSITQVAELASCLEAMCYKVRCRFPDLHSNWIDVLQAERCSAGLYVVMARQQFKEYGSPSFEHMPIVVLDDDDDDNDDDDDDNDCNITRDEFLAALETAAHMRGCVVLNQ